MRKHPDRSIWRLLPALVVIAAAAALAFAAADESAHLWPSTRSTSR